MGIGDWDLVKFARNIPGKRIRILREVLVDLEQGPHGNARVHDVLAVVARIVPAARGIEHKRLRVLRHVLRAGRLGKRLRRHRIAPVNNHLVIHVARGACPLARILRQKRHARTLVVEPLGGSLEHVLERVILDHQILAEYLAAHLDGILACGLEFREIHELNILPARIPVRCCPRSHGKGRLAGRVHDFDIARGAHQRELLGVGRAVTHLVYVGIGCKGRRNTGGNGRGKHDQLDSIRFQNILSCARKVVIHLNTI